VRVHRKRIRDAFWRSVDKRGHDECWEWTGTRFGKGYGSMTIGDVRGAHRLSYEIAHGKASASGKQVCHKCDNPPCCNPAHLFLGTAADNARDKELKGRGNQVYGERHCRAKLTEDAAREIAASTGTTASVAAAYGITPGKVSNIRNGRAWSRATGICPPGRQSRVA
jgi:hypothetical protein